MARIQFFDAAEVEPQEAFEVLPPGKYRVQIVASEERPTKDGNGSYIWLEMEILEGEHAGRKLWDRLNINNANQQAVDIARRALSAICHAVGELALEDTEQLHFKPMIATVRVRPPKDGYDASNDIRGYSAVDDQPAARAPAARPAPAPRPAPAQAARPAGNGGQAPWKRGAA